MSPLQWALLIFAVIAVVAVYLLSRRDRRALDSDETLGTAPSMSTARERQLDIFGAEGQQFDEFGVGKPRRIEPSVGDHDGATDRDVVSDAGSSPAAPAAAKYIGPRIRPFDAIDMPPEASDLRQPPLPIPPRGPTAAGLAPPISASASTPGLVKGMPPTLRPAAEPASEPRQGPKPAQKIVSLLIAEREGLQFGGPELHAALEDEGLQFGTRLIYHRLHEDEAVFSVASLLKPGHLDPDQAAAFTTPGLTLFMVLPGPVRAPDAIRDMIATAERLAQALHAEVFDARKQTFTPSSARALQQEVEAWARANPVH